MGSASFPPSRPVEPERLPWWSHVQPDGVCRWRSTWIPHVRVLFFATAALWVAFVATLTALQSKTSGWLILWLWPTVAIVLGIAQVRLPTWLLGLHLVGAGILGYTAVYTGQRVGGDAVLTTLLIAALATFYAVVPVLSRAYAASGKADREVPTQIRDQRVFGVAGSGLAQARGWRRSAVESGLLGEALTGELLEHYLTRIPSARIFHSLVWPGSLTADVDHAVLCGRRLLLIDSKHWPPGNYTFARDGNLLRAGRPFFGSEVRFPSAVAAYQRLLPRSRVRGVMLVHANRAGTVNVSPSPWPNVQIVTAPEFLADTCGWLADQPDMIDTRAVATLRRLTNIHY